MRIKILLLSVYLSLAAGCSAVSTSYLDADAKTFKAIVPYYLRQVKADAALSSDQKDSKLALTRSWWDRLDTSGADHALIGERPPMTFAAPVTGTAQ